MASHDFLERIALIMAGSELPESIADGSLEGAQIQWKSNVEVVNISCYLMVGIYPRYPLFVFKNG